MGWGERGPVTITFDPVPFLAEMRRAADAVDRLADAMTAPAAALDFLAVIDPTELDDAVMKRKNMATPLMETVLEVLREWASVA
jgi:hypothetical protein